MIKKIALTIMSLLIIGQVFAQTKQSEKTNEMEQILTKDYRTFKVSDNVKMYRVTFKNLYNMKVAGHLFIPLNFNMNEQHAAIIVGHPMGAVKEQSADVYASNMANRGFITLAIDLSFWGESAGEPRNAVLPDVYAEDFSAAVDFLGTRPFVARERIGIIGVCGSGSFVISAAKIDPRMKAIATVSMYNMGAANRNALNHSQTLEQRKKIITEAAEQRYVEFTGGENKYTSGTVHKLDENTPQIQREFYDFYRTPRGEFTPAGSSSRVTTHPTLTSNVKFMNFYPFGTSKRFLPEADSVARQRRIMENVVSHFSTPLFLHFIPKTGHFGKQRETSKSRFLL